MMQGAALFYVGGRDKCVFESPGTCGQPKTPMNRLNVSRKTRNDPVMI